MLQAVVKAPLISFNLFFLLCLTYKGTNFVPDIY